MKIVTAALIVALVAFMASVGVTSADAGPHRGKFLDSTVDGCAGCHRTHTAVGAKLLKASSTVALCLTCHGAGSNLDVVNGVDGGVAVRGGGFQNASIDGVLGLAGTSAPVTSAHMKGPDASYPINNGLTPKNMMWGNGGAGSAGKNMAVAPNTSLSCADCHTPHGGAGPGNSATYRILRPIPLQSGAGTGVVLADEATKVYTTADYWGQYKAGATTPWAVTEMSQWCSSCHTRYAAGSSAGHTDSGDTIFTFRHVSDGTSGKSPTTGAWAGQGTFQAACIQCHVSHGSSAQYNATRINSDDIPWPGETARRGMETTLLKINNRGTCVACHGQNPDNP